MNLYLALDEARTWAAAQGVPLSFASSPAGDLIIRGVKMPPTPSEGPGRTEPLAQGQWEVSAVELRRGFAIDPVPLLGAAPVPGLGATLQTFFGTPGGVAMLATRLQDDQNEVTQAIIAKAADIRVRLAAGQDCCPWPEALDVPAKGPARPALPAFKAAPPRDPATLPAFLRPRP